MDWALIVSALWLGLAGSPHCVAMCSAPCHAACGGPGAGPMAGFQLGRVAGYALAGAAAASSMALLAQWAQGTAALRPLWALLHAACLVTGLWMLWQARWPRWLGGDLRTAALRPDGTAVVRVMRGPIKSTAAGLLWVAWPCGLLQSALLSAALATNAAAGAAVMAAFALASAPALMWAPRLVRGLVTVWRRGSPAALEIDASRWSARVGGATLAGASLWAVLGPVGQRVMCWTPA